RHSPLPLCRSQSEESIRPRFIRKKSTADCGKNRKNVLRGTAVYLVRQTARDRPNPTPEHTPSSPRSLHLLHSLNALLKRTHAKNPRLTHIVRRSGSCFAIIVPPSLPSRRQIYRERCDDISLLLSLGRGS